MHDVAVQPSLKLLNKNDTMPICKNLAIKPNESEPKVKSEGTEMTEVEEAK